MTAQSLYERLGGVNAIALVVDRFSDQIVVNPNLNVNPALRVWNETGQLPGLKFMRTLWVCRATGGPYHGRRVRRGRSGDRPRTRLLLCAGAGKAGSPGRHRRAQG